MAKLFLYLTASTFVLLIAVDARNRHSRSSTSRAEPSGGSSAQLEYFDQYGTPVSSGKSDYGPPNRHGLYFYQGSWQPIEQIYTQELAIGNLITMEEAQPSYPISSNYEAAPSGSSSQPQYYDEYGTPVASGKSVYGQPNQGGLYYDQGHWQSMQNIQPQQPTAAEPTGEKRLHSSGWYLKSDEGEAGWFNSPYEGKYPEHQEPEPPPVAQGSNSPKLDQLIQMGYTYDQIARMSLTLAERHRLEELMAYQPPPAQEETPWEDPLQFRPIE